MKRALAIALLACAAPAWACVATLQKAAVEIEKRFPENPHSTIYDCVRPFFNERDSEYEDALPKDQEAFLHALLRLSPRVTGYVHRADYLYFVQEAGSRYLALCSERELPRVRCQNALDAWGRSTLLLNDWSVLDELAEYANRGTSWFNKDAVRLWESALRCRSDADCKARDFTCAAKGECGTNEMLAQWTRTAEGLGQCRAFAAFLARAVTEPRLGVTPPKKALYERLCSGQ